MKKCSAAGEEIPEDEEVVVDMSGFEATPEMIEKAGRSKGYCMQM